MKEKYPYSLGPDGLGRFFVLGDEGRKELKVSDDDQKKIEKAIEGIINMVEQLDDIKNASDEDCLDKEEKFLKWLEENVMPLEATSTTDKATLDEIEHLKKEMKKEIDSEREAISKKRRKEEKVGNCTFDDDKTALGNIKKKECADNKNCIKRPIFLDGKPLEVKPAPKYDTVSFKEALDGEREILSKKKEEEKAKECKNRCSKKCADRFFEERIDKDGRKCYIAHPFGSGDECKWKEGKNKIHVNDGILAIKSEIQNRSESPYFEESLIRTITVKLPDDSDFGSVRAFNDPVKGLMIKVLKKEPEKKGSYYAVTIE